MFSFIFGLLFLINDVKDEYWDSGCGLCVGAQSNQTSDYHIWMEAKRPAG